MNLMKNNSDEDNKRNKKKPVKLYQRARPENLLL